jgi:class 3 adenylate cyclase
VTVDDRDSAGMRVSDAERDAVVTTLRGHHESGRLTFEEFSERVDEAIAARTDVQLDEALRELPRTPSGGTRKPPPPEYPMHGLLRRWRRPRAAVARFVGINGICIGVWAASGGGYFWPVWLLIPTGALVASRMIAHGSPDHGDIDAQVAIGLTPPPPRPASEPQNRRVVMTVLYVDIVGSTAHAVAMGDAAWNAVLADYERRVVAALEELRGEKLFTKGDEVVAGFFLPASAVECGLRIRDAASGLGLEVRAGAHAGEVDRIGNQASGIAMHIGRRVCEVAEPGQLLVSSTVRDLLAGSSLSFTAAGEHQLKGLNGAWQLYEPVR